jgi:dienelactone hydrolase
MRASWRLWFILLAATPAICRGDDSRGRIVPWLEEVQQPPPSLPEGTARLSPLTPTGATVNRAAWEQRRAELRDQWLTFLGPLSRERLDRPAGRRTPPATTLLEDVVVDGVRRQLIRYEVEPGQPVEAYLLYPEALQQPAPGVVVFHSTVASSLRQPAGVEGAPEKAFGLLLAQRGCVTISPRNYLWPDNHHIAARQEAEKFLQRQPRSKGMDRMLVDGIAAVDLLLAHPLVDGERIGCIGHSLGAKEALYLAAFDERVRASVSSEGGVGTTYSNWDAAWYLGESIRAEDFEREHHELLSLVAPRPFLLVGGNSADGDQSWPFVAAALPIYRLYGDPPRVGLLNHRQGHSVPPEARDRMLEWMTTCLGGE